MKRGPFLPGDGFILLMFLVVLMSLLILIYDARKAEPADGFSSQDRVAEICAIRWLRELAAANRIPLNGEDGHGRAWDELLAACEQDPLMLEWPSKVTMDSVLNDGP